MTRIPENREADFVQAGQLAIDVIHSEEFLTQFRDYMQRNPLLPGDTSWTGLTPEGIAEGLRKKLPNLEVETFGGLVAWWKAWWSGNTGLDGGDAGPVSINRHALKRREMSQVANTIVHEAAHRAGMTHPASDVSLPQAFCQPPYVIGTIVERMVKGPEWTWNSSQHCTTFQETR